MDEKYMMLNIESVSFDTDNPRIKKALEKYGDKVNAERIHFALRSATDESNGTSSYNRLQDSIRAKGGAAVPIKVAIKSNGEKVCIDGNTRLAIYKKFYQETGDRCWAKIRAIVHNNISPREIEEIRVTAHLVGARAWPAYEKARYLHYLRNQEFMDYDEMIALCGGNRKEIERQIEAYHDMNYYYRDKVDDAAFHIDRFSGFVELQRPGIKDAIYEAGLELEDFGKWIQHGNIRRLADVRRLPEILRDESAKKIFLEGGPSSIKDAISDYERRAEKKLPGKLSLERAKWHEIAKELAKRISDLPRSEWRALRDREHASADDQIRVLEDLAEQVRDLLEDVAK